LHSENDCLYCPGIAENFKNNLRSAKKKQYGIAIYTECKDKVDCIKT